jgi:hypothetical protein
MPVTSPCTRHWYLYTLPLMAALFTPSPAAETPASRVLSTPLALQKAKFDLRKRELLPTILKALEDEIAYWEPIADKKQGRVKRPAKPDLKDVVRGLKEMRRTVRDMQSGALPYDDGARKLLEINWTVRDEFRTPYIWRSELELTSLLYRFRDVSLNAVGRGNPGRPAINLASPSAPDLSRVDPLPSTFWYRPGPISEKDLYYGFERKSIPSIAGQICTYDSPHSGYGFHPSFDVKTPDGKKWRAKFGEEHHSPFGSRLMWALGYPTQVSDYCTEVKVKWDRRIFTEFNSRSANALYVKLFGLTVLNNNDIAFQSPFPLIRYAVMKDGSQISAEELRQGLFASVLPPSPQKTRTRYAYDYANEVWFPISEKLPRPLHPEADEQYYDSEFEKRIDHLVFIQINLRSREEEDDVTQLGSWDFNYLDHPDLRELRGMAILQGWIDNWDIRPDNGHIRIVKHESGPARLEHAVTDMGALFGNSTGFVRLHDGGLRSGLFQDSPNAFTWVFTHAQRPGLKTVPIANYMPITKTAPFYWMNMDDARWMARMLCQLSENQIKQAFIASGYDAATARLLLEKLASRRDHMIRHLGLEGEVTFWRPTGENRKLDYDPATDGPFETTLKDGKRVRARVDPMRYISQGRLRYRKSGS